VLLYLLFFGGKKKFLPLLSAALDVSTLGSKLNVPEGTLCKQIEDRPVVRKSQQCFESHD